MAYEDRDWNRAKDVIAKSVTLAAIDVDPITGLCVNPFSPMSHVMINDRDEYTVGHRVYRAYDLATITEVNDIRLDIVIDTYHGIPHGTPHRTYGIGILANHLEVMVPHHNGIDFLRKCVCQVDISLFFDRSNDIEIIVAKVSKVLHNHISMADVSIPVEKFHIDHRNEFTIKQDIKVWQHHNYGIFIDGSVNPIHHGILQLNGQDRFCKRDGHYFNYVQPYQHFSCTPSDGINVYSFALRPEEHQPTGSCNFFPELIPLF